MTKQNQTLPEGFFALQAQICKAIAHEKRLEILACLKEGETHVDAIAQTLGISKASTSQHLQILKQAGVVVRRKQGQFVFYRIFSPKVTQACDLMRQALLEHINHITGQTNSPSR